MHWSLRLILAWMVVLFVGGLIGMLTTGCKRRVVHGAAEAPGPGASWSGLNRATAACWSDAMSGTYGIQTCVDGGRVFRCITEDGLRFQCGPLGAPSTSAEAR